MIQNPIRIEPIALKTPRRVTNFNGVLLKLTNPSIASFTRLWNVY